MTNESVMRGAVTTVPLRSAARWREECAGEIFPTAGSWAWFRRQHAAELIKRGVLVPGRGRRGDLVAGDIAAVVTEILRRGDSGVACRG